MLSRARPTLEALRRVERPDRRPLAVAATTLLLACGIGLGVVALLVAVARGPSVPAAVVRVRVPDVIALPARTAMATLRRAGLRVRAQRVAWEGSHIVLEQVPAPGATAAVGSPVTVRIRCVSAPCS